MVFLPHVILLIFTALFVDAKPELSVTLASKLEHQFKIFDSGRQYLVDRVVDQKSSVDRAEWDYFLNPKDDTMEITDAEKVILTSYHDDLTKEARLQAKEESSLMNINIDDFRNDTDRIKKFCRIFPRIALLHIHPGGTGKLDTVKFALETINPVINTTALAEIDMLPRNLTMLYEYEVDYLNSIDPPVAHYMEYNAEQKDFFVNLMALPKEPCCHPFKRFESIFEIKWLLFEKQSDANATFFNDLLYKDFLERNAAFGISYVEFTKTQIPYTFEKMKKYNDYLIEQQSKHGTDFVLNYNVAYVRTFLPSDNAGHAQTMIEALENTTTRTTDLSTVVGIDYLGQEDVVTLATSALEGQDVYIPTYDAWKVKGNIDLGGMTMHAGEIGPDSPVNVRDAIIMGSTRIGHGPQVNKDPVLVEYSRRKKVPFVESIVSNWMLKVIPNDDLKLHPFLRFIRLGIPISLSTDDEGVFHTDIANECEVAIFNSDIQYSELKAISYTAVTASFANETVKDSLTTALNDKFLSFEASYEAPSPTLPPVQPAPTHLPTQKLTKNKKSAKKTSKK